MEQPGGFDPLYEATVVRLRTNPRSATDWFPFVVIAMLVIATGSGPDSAVALVVVLVLSDLVRLATMKALDTFDQRLLVLPLVRGELPIGTTPGREGTLILVRPFFLVLLSLVTWLISRATGPGVVLEICRTSAVLAAFTLLPFKPCEGWRLLNLTLFSRSLRFEAAVSVITSLLLAGLGLWGRAWLLAIFSLFNALGTRLTVATAKAADALRGGEHDFNVQTRDLPPTAMRALYAASRALLNLNAATDLDLGATQLADVMRRVHLRLTARPPPLPATLVLLASYAVLVAFVALGLVAALGATSP